MRRGANHDTRGSGQETQQIRSQDIPFHHRRRQEDRRLSEKDINTITAWVDQGAKEGNARDLPPAPQFVEGWNIGTPDAVFGDPALRRAYRNNARARELLVETPQL